MSEMARERLGDRLVGVALDREQRFGVAPQITSSIAEYDAARLVGHTDDSYSTDRAGRTAVTRGSDFTHLGIRYQVKANRPSGKPGARVTLVAKARSFDWDRLIWLFYDRTYQLQEAWEWRCADNRTATAPLRLVSPPDVRRGRNFVATSASARE